MQFDTYLFDFDGTLVDSMPYYIAAMLRLLDENNIPYGDDIIKIITPLGYAGTAAYFRQQLGLPMEEDAIVTRMKAYAYEAYASRIPAKASVIETLRKLKDRGASLSILTASPHAVLDVCLNRLGIFDLFQNVWSCDDFNTTKADPDIYRRAVEKLGRPVEKVLFLDDNCNACKTAASAGMPVCGVFDPSSGEYTEEMKRICDFYIEDFTQLL